MPNEEKQEKCYSCGGKGTYSQMHGTHGSEDFGNDGFDIAPSIHNYPCNACNGTGLKIVPQEKLKCDCGESSPCVVTDENLVVCNHSPQEKHKNIPLEENLFVLAWDARCETCNKGIKHEAKELTEKDIPFLPQETNKGWEERFIEQAAAMEHARWARWQKYLFSKSIMDSSGARITIDLVERWNRQIETPYSELSEAEKESDRKEAREYLPLISQELSLAKKEGQEEERQFILNILDGIDIADAQMGLGNNTKAIRYALQSRIIS